MEANVNKLFPELQNCSGASNAEKRPTKSRSRVWEKVVWFTRKAKGGKDSKTSSPELHKGNIGRAGDSKTLDCKPKVRKTRSFKYLKRRKVRQFGGDLSSVAVEEEVNVQDCGTATGTFHDFQSERRISRQEKTASNSSLLSEMAKGMKPAQQEVIKENVKSVLSLPIINDLSLNEGPTSESLSPSFPRVRRSVSFSGPAYNSWPRKKRIYLENSSRGELLLSPPSKQKCVTGTIRKRASFSGFDSSKINLKNSYLSLYKGVKSTPHLPQGGNIQNQNGLTIGAIHFYKSPAIYQKDETTLKLLQRKRQPKPTDDESCVANAGLLGSSCGSNLEKDGTLSPLLPRESDAITCNGIPETTEKLNANANSNSSLNKDSCQRGLTCTEQTDNINVSDGPDNCLSFHVKNIDVQNSTISAFLLEGESSSSCITNSPVDSPDEDLVKEKPLLSCNSTEKVMHVSSTNENVIARDNNFSYTMLESKTPMHEDGSTRSHSSGSDEAMDIPECYTYANHTSQPSAIHQDKSLPATVSEVISADNEIDNAVFSATQCNTQHATAPSCRLPSVDEVGTYGNLQTLRTRNELVWQRKPTVSGPQFKKHTEVTKNNYWCC